MADMQRFSAKRGCPKCGCLDLATQWMPAAENRSPWEGKERREHIQRHCRRCHFQWNEAPLVAGPPCESGERAPQPSAAPGDEARPRHPCACGHAHNAGMDGEDGGCSDSACPCGRWRAPSSPRVGGSGGKEERR